MERGRPAPLGATVDREGVNFAVFSGCAEAVELCLFEPDGRQSGRYRLPECTDGVWHGRLPGCTAGQAYGYRVHGPYDPSRGLRCNPGKLLVDPYARALAGTLRWGPEVYDFVPGAVSGDWRMSQLDSADCVPKAVVAAPRAAASPGPRVPWSDTVIYEANVRGFTMRHPDIPARERGRFSGLSNGRIVEYLKALGVTTVELQPVQAFVDEPFLAARGLRNLWGYNTLGFLAVEPRYACAAPVDEFVAMVEALHAAGLEVILDVAYNHTAESDAHGPTLSLRGLDNLAYYRMEPDAPGRYINDSGCGNSLNVDHPRAQDLVLDSLAHWHRELGVDGFRFDLAASLGRSPAGFDPGHPLLRRISEDPRLARAKLIAEPWDAGPGGYQLGGFPAAWSEWNDRFRDDVRRFWRGDPGRAGALARRLHGSADLFEPGGRGPRASVNFVTSHDGFTLADLVSYVARHNQANGEDNRDGHAHNYSCNHGAEGPVADRGIERLRRRHRLNLMATLLLSQGTPMLLAGDEFGNGQRGNNNAYCQDNETGWLDWGGLDADPGFLDRVRELIRLRRAAPLLRQAAYAHGVEGPGIAWLHASGAPMSADQWRRARSFGLLLSDEDGARGPDVFILINGAHSARDFVLPPIPPGGAWRPAFSSAGPDGLEWRDGSCRLGPFSIACLTAAGGR